MLRPFYDMLIPGKSLFTHENKTSIMLTLAQLT